MSNFIIKNCLFIYSLILQCSLINAHQKGDELRELALSSDYGLIVFNAETYNKYVMTHPRPYDVVILYTRKSNCKLCEKVYDEFIQVSDSFRDSNGFKPDMISRKRAVFFGVLYYSEETLPIIKSLKFPSRINILYTTPKNLQFNKLGEPYIEYDEDHILSYNERSNKIYALKMMEFANAKSQRKFPLKKNQIEFLFYFIFFVCLIFIGFSAYNNFKQFLLSPVVWITGSMMIIIICMGGIVYNILRNTPFAKFDNNGNIVEFIHTGRKAQYAGEGIFMSCLFVIGGTLLYSFNWLNQVPNKTKHYFASYIILASIILIIKLMHRIYRIKSKWYGPSFFPPNHYVKGSLINDQGNSF